MKLGTVLVTGGTGTFGRAFARRVLVEGLVDRLRIYSRGEHEQARMRAAFPDDRVRWLIGDVRDGERLTRALDGCDAVIHAAALKRVEVGEYNPSEVVKTNVIGTANAIEAATDVGVRKFITLSSDKACAPINAYGASKLMAEKLTIAANNARGSKGPLFAATRYGNIAGSQGSVIPAWRSGEPWMSDPDCTRFWMRIEEAVDLVLWTLENMAGGELVVPDLPAYRLADLAEAMKLKPEIRGYRGAEKPHETMITELECSQFGRWKNYWISNGYAGAKGMSGPLVSDSVRRMSVEELRSQLESV